MCLCLFIPSHSLYLWVYLSVTFLYSCFGFTVLISSYFTFYFQTKAKSGGLVARQPAFNALTWVLLQSLARPVALDKYWWYNMISCAYSPLSLRINVNKSYQTGCLSTLKHDLQSQLFYNCPTRVNEFVLNSKTLHMKVLNLT